MKSLTVVLSGVLFGEVQRELSGVDEGDTNGTANRVRW